MNGNCSQGEFGLNVSEDTCHFCMRRAAGLIFIDFKGCLADGRAGLFYVLCVTLLSARKEQRRNPGPFFSLFHAWPVS
jgi:hypothetical protein